MPKSHHTGNYHDHVKRLGEKLQKLNAENKAKRRKRLIFEYVPSTKPQKPHHGLSEQS